MVLLLGGGQGHRLLDAGGRTRLNRWGGGCQVPTRGTRATFREAGSGASEWRWAGSLVGECTPDPGLGEMGCVRRGSVWGRGVRGG